METIDIDGVSNRYYVKDQNISIDEDDVNEFKGHLNFTKDQIPLHAQDPTYDRP